jgi:hypothetical protein
MSRQDRLKEYAKPGRSENWNGASRDQGYIDRWSERATSNSITKSNVGSFRASDGPMQLADTAGARAAPVKTGDPIKKARADLNHVGSDFYSKVRRTT